MADGGAQGGAAAGKVHFNVTAGVRYPDPADAAAAERERIEREAARLQAEAAASLNLRIAELSEAIYNGSDEEVWGPPDVVPGVGLVVKHLPTGKSYNVDVREAF